MSRYADGWEFNGRSEMYLRETFDLFAADTTDKTGVYKSGMRAIIEECHARALVMVAARKRASMSRVRILSNTVLPYVKSIPTTAILVSPWAGTHVSGSPYSSVALQIYSQFQSDSEGLYIPIRNR